MRHLYRLADAAAVVFAAVGTFVLLFGTFTVALGTIPVRVSGADRLLFVAAALIAIRHVLHPADPLHARLARVFRSTCACVPAPVRSAIGSRLIVLAIGYVGVLSIGLAANETGFTVAADPLMNLPARFDAGWYGTIALEGYSFQGRFDRQQNVAFFPAFPLLMRAAGYPLGAFLPSVPTDRRLARLLWAGVAVSIIAFACAALYLWRLAREMIGDARAADAVVLLAAYPFAVFFSAAYTESLFLLAAVAAFFHFRRKEFAAASSWGLLAGLTRPNGFLLSIVLAAIAVAPAFRPAGCPREAGHDAGHEGLRYIPWLAAAMPGVGMLAFSAYVKHLTGSWFGWARLHETWGRTFSGFAGLADGLSRISNPYDVMNALALVFALALLWPVARRLGAASALFVIVTVVPPLLAGGVLSMGRITSTAFPLFLALAAILPSRVVTPVVTVFAIGQGVAAVLFFTWRPLF
jgi:hypothetical protein